jgi:hypothetical protein
MGKLQTLSAPPEEEVMLPNDRDAKTIRSWVKANEILTAQRDRLAQEMEQLKAELAKVHLEASKGFYTPERERQRLTFKAQAEHAERQAKELVEVLRDLYLYSMAAPYPRNYMIEIKPEYVLKAKNTLAAYDREQEAK